MLHLILGILGILMGFFGVISNLYILLVILFSKKARSISEWILLHLSSCGIGASILILSFSSPSIIYGEWISTVEPLCDVVGASILTLQLLTVWSICALSVDRCSAIVSPLRYTQVVTRRRVAAFFIILWCLSITIVVMAFSISSVYEIPRQDSGLSFHFKDTPSSSSESPPPEIYESWNSSSNSNDISSFNSKTNQVNRFGFLSINSKYLREPDQFTLTTDDDNYQHSDGAMLDLYFANLYNSSKTRSDDLVGEVPHVQDSNSKSTLIYSTEEYSQNSSTNYRSSLGFCLPRMHHLSWVTFVWTGEWIIFVFIAPLSTLLACDLTVLSIAKKQRHRIVMALYQITLSAQATVTRNKGTAPPSLWMSNRAVPARSRACRAVWEDVATIIFLNLPLIIMLVIESIFLEAGIPLALTFMASTSFFVTPSFASLLYGVRARPLKTAYKSYLRKRLTNSTLQHEIEQRLSPVDGSPRSPRSKAKSFRSSTPSPNSSPFQTPHRRQSTNDLRPPTQFSLTLSPSHYHIAGNNIDNNCTIKPRKVRSFLHIPSQADLHEFWSGLRKPNRSPTIIITHEIRTKHSRSSLSSSKSSTPPMNAEHLV